MRLIGIAAAVVFAALGTQAFAQGNPEAGHALVKKACTPCHAVEATGDSPVADAPPFRTFSSKWPLDNLEEALAEGILVGHEGIQMPEFVFEPEEISDIIAYLGSLPSD
jgi:cytochrome c2